jgi:hypothetical protein
MNEIENATSRANPPSLPDSWVEKIFRRMESRYGAKWVDSLGGIDRERVRQAWGEDLASLSPAEIAHGLEACRTRVWPPTLPEFVLLCRPLADARADFEQARVQMAIRLRGNGDDRWSRPEVYWAAVAIGNHDLQVFGWEQLRSRWEYALSTARNDPPPEYRAALPPPGRQSVNREEARARIHHLAAKVATGDGMKFAEPGKQWAVNLMRKEASGAHVDNHATFAWREALQQSPDITASDALKAMGMEAAA